MEKFGSFRDNLAKKITETPKEERKEILAQAKETPEYLQARSEKIKERQGEEEIDNGLGVLMKRKTIYHGSGIGGITKFNEAEEDTVGSGIYFTSDAKDAIGYARRRSRRAEDHKPVVYEANIENVKLLDLRKQENFEKILPGFADKLYEKYEQHKAQNNNVVTGYGVVLMRILQAIDANQISLNNLKTLTQQTGKYFTEYVQSLGFDGLVVMEGGEGDDVHNHDTYLIFDPEKVMINRESTIRFEQERPISELSTPEAGEVEKIKQLFGHCFEISKFDEGDRIPVGGESIFSTEANINVTGDFENFRQFFTETRELAGKYDLPKLKEWLSAQGIEIDEKLFATLFAFTKKFEEKYPDNPERAEARRKLYSEKEKEIKLSDIFGANTAECAEIAALAQGYLQQEGVPSTYFSGDVLWDKDWEFSEEHSFIVIRQGDKVYIYDPTNPVSSTSGKFPSIYTTDVKFDEEMAKNQKRFATAKNLVSKKEAFFGTNNGTNVWAEKDVV